MMCVSTVQGDTPQSSAHVSQSRVQRVGVNLKKKKMLLLKHNREE